MAAHRRLLIVCLCTWSKGLVAGNMRWLWLHCKSYRAMGPGTDRGSSPARRLDLSQQEVGVEPTLLTALIIIIIRPPSPTLPSHADATDMEREVDKLRLADEVRVFKLSIGADSGRAGEGPVSEHDHACPSVTSSAYHA